MIIDRYVRPENWTPAPLSDPILQELDVLLEDSRLLALCRHDLAAHYKPTKKGRPPVAVEVTVRMTILRRRKKWSYRQAEQEVRDSLAYRQWVRVYDHPVPDYTTLHDLERAIHPTTLHRLNDRLLVLAQTYRLTHGYKLRLDSSVTETNIHYPTDSSLLLDGVRVLSRWLKAAVSLLPETAPERDLCHSHFRRARRCAQQIGRLSRKGQKGSTKRRELPAKQKAMYKAYLTLLRSARTTLDQARPVREALQTQPELAAQQLAKQLVAFIPLVEQAVDQAARRVRHGEAVPAPEKLVSLFETHTAIIRRGKAAPHETEFGHKVNYAEVEHGLISDWEVLAVGNPPDARMLPPLLRQHRKRFGHVPRVLAGDRGVFSPANERLAKKMGVEQIALPQTGRRSDERTVQEKQRCQSDFSKKN